MKIGDTVLSLLSKTLHPIHHFSKKLKKSCVSLLLFLPAFHLASNTYAEALYNSLDPLSITQHLALYKLYPEDPVAQKALQDVRNLLKKGQQDIEASSELPSSLLTLDGFLSITQGKLENNFLLSESHLQAVETLGSHLGNRKLKGHQITTEKELKALEESEIDLARALLIAQHDHQPVDWTWVRNYEAQIDFMALQILARLPKNPTPEQVIEQINRLVFFDLHYRFPSMSALQKQDPYSTLNTVLDSKNGVCLGISILYLCIAQRLEFPLEIVIPPGHIFVRYKKDQKVINIETTARGVNVPSDHYLDVNTKSLQEATLKQVIGFIFYNFAANDLTQTQNYSKAIHHYLKCLEYAPQSPQTFELLGYTYALDGNRKKACETFKQLQKFPYKDRITSIYLDAPSQYLNNEIDRDALQAIISQSHAKDEADFLKQKQTLLKVHNKYPHFKAALFFLSDTCQALSEPKEALTYLKKLHELDSSYPYVELSLAHLYMMEYDFSSAWKHTQKLQEILKNHEHHPKIFKEFKRSLSQQAMEP